MQKLSNIFQISIFKADRNVASFIGRVPELKLGKLNDYLNTVNPNDHDLLYRIIKLRVITQGFFCKLCKFSQSFIKISHNVPFEKRVPLITSENGFNYSDNLVKESEHCEQGKTLEVIGNITSRIQFVNTQ